MIFLRQSTASQEVLLPRMVDSTDGNTAETGLTIANTDIKIHKAGATTQADKNSGGATHISNGDYYIVLDATDTDTIGPLVITCHPTGALYTRVECVVLDEAVYDVLFGTTAPSTYAGADTSGTTTLLSRIGSALTITSGRVNADLTHIAAAAVSTSTAQLGVNVVNFGGSAGTFSSGRPEVNATHWGGTAVASAVVSANAVQISGDSVAADNAEAFFDGTGYAGTNNVIPTVTTTTNLTNKGDGSGFTAIPWNAAWDAEVQSEVQDAVEANHLDHLLAVTYDPASKPGAADALLNELVESDGGVARYTANALEQAPTGGSAPTASAIADEVQTRTIAAVTTVTNLTNLPAITANWLTAAGLAADAGAEIASAVRTELATELGRIDAAITSRLATAGYTSPLDAAGTRTALGLASANLDTQIGTLATQASVNTIDDFLDTEISAIQTAVVTNIPTTLSTIAGYLDTEVAAIKAKTDNLPASPAASSDCITAAGVRTAVGLASANLDTQIGTLATASSLSTVAGYIDTEVAAIKAKTDNLPSSFPTNFGAMSITVGGMVGVDGTSVLAEAYPADGASTASLAALLYEIAQNITEFAISGTTLTVKKKDSTTTAETYTLDDATSPTSRTRAT